MAIESSLEREMRVRARRHLLTSLGGFVLAIAMLALLGSLNAWLLGGRLPLAFGAAVSILLIPAVGFTSTFRNLRCPACEGLVAFQVSANASIFGAAARKTCRHCGKTIFGDSFSRGSRRVIFVAFAVGALGAIGSILARTRH